MQTVHSHVCAYAHTTACLQSCVCLSTYHGMQTAYSHVMCRVCAYAHLLSTHVCTSSRNSSTSSQQGAAKIGTGKRDLRGMVDCPCELLRMHYAPGLGSIEPVLHTQCLCSEHGQRFYSELPRELGKTWIFVNTLSYKRGPCVDPHGRL